MIDTTQVRPRYRLIRNFDYVDALVDGSRTVTFSNDSTLVVVGTGAAADTTVTYTNRRLPVGTFVEFVRGRAG